MFEQYEQALIQASSCPHSFQPLNRTPAPAPSGMFEQYQQALIQASYGRLSLSPEVLVLDEVRVPRELEAGSDNFTYYEDPALQVGSSCVCLVVLDEVVVPREGAEEGWAEWGGIEGCAGGCYSSRQPCAGCPP